MYISAIKKTEKRTAVLYLAVTLFCILFNYIYSLFGHDVSSLFMSLLFLFPLCGGALPYALLMLFSPKPVSCIAYNLYNSGLATLCTGSCLQGVFEIAGTSSAFMPVFWVGGALLLLSGIVVFTFSAVKTSDKRN